VRQERRRGAASQVKEVAGHGAVELVPDTSEPGSDAELGGPGRLYGRTRGGNRRLENVSNAVSAETESGGEPKRP
jgi:hypothetical protein